MNPSNDDAVAEREVLRDGELTVLGRIRSASNATFLCESTLGEHSVHCVYKPIAGENPLWDFPDGTLAAREVATYEVSEALGWPGAVGRPDLESLQPAARATTARAVRVLRAIDMVVSLLLCG